jgi:hypothetical protein
MSGLEKARALEAVKITAHLVAAQDKFKSECYNEVDDACQYATSFEKLPVEISGQGKNIGGATTVSGGTAITSNFTYTLSANAVTATPRSSSYSYTITANYEDDIIYCNIGGSEGSSQFNSGKKICSSIGTKTDDKSKYKID